MEQVGYPFDNSFADFSFYSLFCGGNAYCSRLLVSGKLPNPTKKLSYPQ